MSNRIKTTSEAIYPSREEDDSFHSNPNLTPLSEIGEPQELPDGGVVYNIGNAPEQPTEENVNPSFYENLAIKLQPEKLSVLSAKLLDDIKQDQETRTEWEKTITLAMRYLGFTIEEFKNVPFMKACSAFDSTLSTALLNFYSVSRAELFPAMGPARSEIIGVSTPEIEDQGERVKMFLNWYLTQKDKDYYPNSERLLMYLGLFGCAFRKVYQDPILNRPVARLVCPQDFIINHYTTSIMSSDRMTEVVYLNRKEVLLRQRDGDFVEFELPIMADDGQEDSSPVRKKIAGSDGIKSGFSENKSLFKFYESHVNLQISEVETKKNGDKYKDIRIPRPYIVTICESTRKVVSIKRNWKEDDQNYERMEYYVNYSYLPGFGIYSLGLAHIMGSNAITLTSILRQLIDAGTLKNFPGGLRIRGMRLEDNDKAIGPSEFREIETGGMAIQDCLMMMPYSEPSQVLVGLRQELKGESSNIASAVESTIPEMGNNAPVGTTLAMLEVANKVQSSILRSLHVSLGYELKLLFDLFGEYLEETQYPFSVPGKDVSIVKKDFNDRVNIVPVSDPNVLTSTHRLMRNEAMLKLAQSNPDIHDIREAYYRMYSAMNVDNIEKLLPPKPEPKALDPLTENMIMVSGQEATVKMFQDDASHIIVHQQFLQNPMIQQNPQAYSSVSLHIQKHKAFKVYKDLYRERKIKELEEHLYKESIGMAEQAMANGYPPIPPEVIENQVKNGLLSKQEEIESEIPQVSDEEEQQIGMLPEIQNRIAHEDASQMIQEAQQQAEEAANALNPDKVMIMDIDQKREASHLKDEESKLKAETESFKAQLKYESEMAKTESQRDIASEKNEIDLLDIEQKSKGIAEFNHERDI